MILIVVRDIRDIINVESNAKLLQGVLGATVTCLKGCAASHTSQNLVCNIAN